MSPKPVLTRIDPGSYRVTGSDVRVLQTFRDWEIYRDNSGGCTYERLAVLPTLKACRTYLEEHPELSEGK